MHVLILVDAETGDGDRNAAIDEMVNAMRQAIASAPLKAISHIVNVNNKGNSADTALKQVQQVRDGLIICPLTLNVPQRLGFAHNALYETCRDVEQLRRWVQQKVEVTLGTGTLWLPVVLTAKGPLYGEVITEVDEIGEQHSSNGSLESGSLKSAPSRYQQPLHLSDQQRQQVYRLGRAVLRSLSAPPATYLLQFGLQDSSICFDRLFPFPAAPAIASIGVQVPNLFACHWRCLTGQPVQDLVIVPP